MEEERSLSLVSVGQSTGPIHILTGRNLYCYTSYFSTIVCDISTGTIVRVIQSESPTLSCSFSEYLYVLDEVSLKAYEINSWKEICKVDSYGCSLLVTIQGLDCIYICGVLKDEIMIWQHRNQGIKVIVNYETDMDNIMSVCTSSLGNIAVVGEKHPCCVYIWNLCSLSPKLYELDTVSDITHFEWINQDVLLIHTSLGDVQFWTYSLNATSFTCSFMINSSSFEGMECDYFVASTCLKPLKSCDKKQLVIPESKSVRSFTLVMPSVTSNEGVYYGKMKLAQVLKQAYIKTHYEGHEDQMNNNQAMKHGKEREALTWLLIIDRNGKFHIMFIHQKSTKSKCFASLFVSIKTKYFVRNERLELLGVYSSGGLFSWDNAEFESPYEFPSSIRVICRSIYEYKYSYIRSFNLRSNERSSKLILKSGGHESCISKVVCHPILPYCATCSNDKLVNIWKLEFPHTFSSLDQTLCGSGMSLMTTFTSCNNELLIDLTWVPHRSRPTIALLFNNRVDFLTPLSNVNGFPELEDSWGIVTSLEYNYTGVPLHIQTCIFYTDKGKQDFVDIESRTIPPLYLVICTTFSIESFILNSDFEPDIQFPKVESISLKDYITDHDEEITCFDMRVSPYLQTNNVMQLDIVIGLNLGRICLFHIEILDSRSISFNIVHTTESYISKVYLNSVNSIMFTDSTGVHVIEKTSIDKYSVSLSSCKPSNISTCCILGDGLVRICIAECNVEKLFVRLFLPNVHYQQVGSWKETILDISTSLKFIDNVDKLKITSIGFTGHGALVICMNHNVFFLPAHQILLQSQSTSILPVPEYNPEFLRELLSQGELSIVSRILFETLKSSNYLKETVDSRYLMPEIPIDTLFEYLNSNVSVVFTNNQVVELEQVLFTRKLPFMSSRDNLNLIGVMKAYKAVKSNIQSLDTASIRVLVSLQHAVFLKAQRIVDYILLNSVDYMWGMHCTMPYYLLQLSLQLVSKVDWEFLKSIGFGYWTLSIKELTEQIEVIAQEQYKTRRNPLDCMVFYIALDRISLLLQLFKVSQRSKQSEIIIKYLEKDYSIKQNQDDAYTLGMNLIKKQKYLGSLAFMLLSRHYEYAMTICATYLEDLQLGIVISRLLSGKGMLFINFVNMQVIPYAVNSKDIWLHHIGLWLIGDKLASIELVVKSLGDCRISWASEALEFIKYILTIKIGVKDLKDILTVKVMNELRYLASRYYFYRRWSFLAMVNVSSIDLQDCDKGLVSSLLQLKRDICDSLFAMRIALKLPLYERSRLNVDYYSRKDMIPEVKPVNSGIQLDFEVLQEFDSDSDWSSEDIVELEVEDIEYKVSTKISLSILDEIEYIYQYFSFSTIRSLDNVKVYSRAHHLFLPYMDIQYLTTHSKAVLGFLKSELDSLCSLVYSSCDIVGIPSRICRRLTACVRIVIEWARHWDDDLKSIIRGIASMTLFLVGISSGDWEIVYELVKCDIVSYEDCEGALEIALLHKLIPPAVRFWTETFKYDYGEYVILEEKYKSDDCQVKESNVEELSLDIFFILSLKRFVQVFNKSFITREHAGNASIPVINLLSDLYNGILTCWDEQCTEFPEHVEQVLQYSRKCTLSKLSLNDVLNPLSMCVDSGKYSLHEHLKVTQIGKNFEDSFRKMSKVEYDSSMFYDVIEVCKLPCKLLSKVAVNAVDPALIAVGTSSGLLELNTESWIRFGNSGIQNVDYDSWEANLHRFNHLEAIGYTCLDTIYLDKFPSCYAYGKLLNDYCPVKSDQLVSVKRLLCMKDHIHGYIHRRDRLMEVCVGCCVCLTNLSSEVQDRIHLWEFEWPSSKKTFHAPDFNQICSIKLGISGDVFSCTSLNGHLGLWNMYSDDTTPFQMFPKFSKGCWDSEFLNSDRVLVATGGYDKLGNTRIVDSLSHRLEVGNISCVADKGFGTCVSYSADDDVLCIGGSSGSISLIDMRTRCSFKDMANCHGGRVKSVQFWKDFIVSGGVDGTVNVWSKAGELLEYSEGMFAKKTIMYGASGGFDSSVVLGITCSPSGIYCTGSKGSLKYWRMKT